MLSYYSILLPCCKKAIKKVTQQMCLLLLKKKGQYGSSWIAWDFFCTPKWLGDAALLIFFEHMVAAERA